MSEKEKKIVKITSLLVNKKGLSDYEVLRDYECSIKLLGHEVKSIRAKQFHMKASFVNIRENDIYIQKLHISPYKMLPNNTSIDPEQERKLFLRKKEVANLSQKIKEKGFTIIPIEVYLKGNLVKVRIALVRGKKQYEKKDAIKRRDIDMDIRKSLKEL